MSRTGTITHSLPMTKADALAALRRMSNPFVASRFPHTYGFDFLLAHAAAFGIPTASAGSRAEISLFILDHTAGPAEYMQVITACAEAYLIQHSIAAPSRAAT